MNMVKRLQTWTKDPFLTKWPNPRTF